jgi:hypothetical protein
MGRQWPVGRRPIVASLSQRIDKRDIVACGEIDDARGRRTAQLRPCMGSLSIVSGKRSVEPCLLVRDYEVAGSTRAVLHPLSHSRLVGSIGETASVEERPGPDRGWPGGRGQACGVASVPAKALRWSFVTLTSTVRAQRSEVRPSAASWPATRVLHAVSATALTARIARCVRDQSPAPEPTSLANGNGVQRWIALLGSGSKSWYRTDIQFPLAVPRPRHHAYIKKNAQGIIAERVWVVLAVFTVARPRRGPLT